MAPEQVGQASTLFESGRSLSEVSEPLNADQETMRTAIIKAGVEFRPATGAV